MTKKCNRLRGERPKAFWGALVGGAMNLIGSAISSKAQARAIKRQIEAQKEAAQTQLELANNSNLASTLNSYAAATRSYNDEDYYNLKYRLGGNKRLGSNRIYITDGGDATKIGNDTYLLRGGSHEQTNETGQTGIGINVGGNEVEAEGGEVAQKKNGALRIFSAQPILSNGMSPAQAILRGYNKDKVFKQQQAFKRRNGIKDDGSKAAFGNLITMPFAGIVKDVVDYFSNSGKYAPKRVKVSNKTVNRKPIRNGQVGNFRIVNGKYFPNEKPLRQVYPEFDIISMGRGLPIKRSLKNTVGFVQKPNTFTRGIGNSEGIKDLVESKVVRGNPVGTEMTAKAYTKATKSNRNSFNDIMNGTGREGISHRYYNRSLSKEDFDAIRESYNKINASFKARHPKASGKIRFAIGDDIYDPLGNYKNYDDYLAQIASDRKTLRNATTINPDNGEPIAYFYDDGRNPLTQGHGYASSKWGVRISNPQDYNMKIFDGHLHYSNSKTIPFDSPNVEVFRSTPFGTIRYPKWMLRRGWYRNGGLTSKDRGSSKHPYPSVSSKDFAGGGRSYPIPTKSDAVDALRLAGLHGRSDVKAKVYSRYPELRKKAEMGTIAYNGVPGTDSYRQRIYSGYDASPLTLLNILNYLDRAAGFVDENGNSKYITGIAPTPGIRGRSKILSDINKTNKVARRASISRYFNSRQYHIQPNRTKVSESAIPVERYNNGRYTYQGQFKQWQQGTPYSQTGYPNSHITVSTEPNDAIHGNVGSWWSDFKTKMDLKSQAKQKRNNINIDNRLHKQEVIDRLRRIKEASKQSKFINDLNNYSNEQLGAMRPDSYWDKQMGRFINLSDKVGSVKETGKYALTAGAIGTGASLYGLSRIKSDNNSNNNNNNVTQKDAKGKPISSYIAKPTDNNNIISNKQTPVKKQVTAKSITTRKPIVASKTSKPVSKKLYGLNDNETKVINGQTYVRRGNQVFNTTTKVRYDYSNGKYTGHNKVYGVGDYSHVGKNFNDAFDAARAAGASRFRYNAGKYNQYTTAKETNVKKERLNRIIGSKRIAKRIGGFVLRPKARIGGSWKAPIYNTKKYRVSNRMRKQIATWEGSDFAGQNRRFNGDAIGAKERELRQIMGRTYNYLNDNQRDSLNSIYYNSRVDTFKNRFGKWFKNLNDAVDRGDERAFNNSLAGIRQSMTIGENRQGMSGLAKRRAWERNWFGNPIPMDSNETKAILKQQAEARMVQPIDNTRVVIQPEYIEVPAPIGHGIVPVDNPDLNLLQGNIKDNLINMGNKFRLGQRCGGSTRMRKALGCESRPVKGMRRKLTWGDVTYPYRRNNNFDYWDIIDQEQKANDKGGISPWTTSNKYDVKVPYAITKSTPTIPYTSQVSTPTSKVTENKTIPTYIGNKSGMILRNADWYGLGADLVSSIGGGILGLGAYKNLDFDYNLPKFVEESPVALNTTYHNEAQKSNVERNRLNSRNSILRNTMSGSTAVGRMQGVDTNALYQLNQLADEKTNKETELMNQNLLNEQQVRARNAAAKNQYYNTVTSIKNAAIQAKNEAELAKGQILSGTLQGIGNSFQNFISQGRQNYDDTQAMLMGVAASDYATPSRLLELGVDVGDDAALAGIYRSAMNIPNPGARPKREDYSDNTEYSYALTRWENQNKAYQRRNSYADLIKGRMSKKNLIKYGII